MLVEQEKSLTARKLYRLARDTPALFIPASLNRLIESGYVERYRPDLRGENRYLIPTPFRAACRRQVALGGPIDRWDVYAWIAAACRAYDDQGLPGSTSFNVNAIYYWARSRGKHVAWRDVEVVLRRMWREGILTAHATLPNYFCVNGVGGPRRLARMAGDFPLVPPVRDDQIADPATKPTADAVLAHLANLGRPAKVVELGREPGWAVVVRELVAAGRLGSVAHEDGKLSPADVVYLLHPFVPAPPEPAPPRKGRGLRMIDLS